MFKSLSSVANGREGGLEGERETLQRSGIQVFKINESFS